MATRKGAEHASNILDALEASPKPLSAYELLDQLRPKGVGAPLTVYRALDKLMDAGKVHRVQSLNAFVACRGKDHDCHDHAHASLIGFAICDRCGTVDEFSDPDWADRVVDRLASRGFSAHRSAVEVHGVCGRCAETSPSLRGA